MINRQTIHYYDSASTKLATYLVRFEGHAPLVFQSLPLIEGGFFISGSSTGGERRGTLGVLDSTLDCVALHLDRSSQAVSELDQELIAITTRSLELL